MKPKISVIIPVYNAEKYIESCVQSLVNQEQINFSEVEIIMINDGSSDDSYKKLIELSSIFTNIVVINKSNTGVSETRNKGIEIAKGEYITFLDVDDYLSSDALKIMCLHMENNCLDYLITGISVEFVNDNYIHTHGITNSELLFSDNNIKDFIELVFERDLIGSICGKMYKRDLIIENNIKLNEKFKHHEDLLFNIEYLQKVQKAKIINNPLYHYVKRDNTSSSNYSESLFDDMKYILNEISYLLKYKHIDENLKTKILMEFKLSIIMSNINNLYNKVNFLNKDQKKKQLKILLEDNMLKIDFRYIERNNIFKKIFFLLYKMNNYHLTHLFYSFLFALRKQFKQQYNKMIRPILMNRNN